MFRRINLTIISLIVVSTHLTLAAANELFKGQPIEYRRRSDYRRGTMSSHQKRAYEFENEMMELANKILIMEAKRRIQWGGQRISLVIPIPLSKKGISTLKRYRAGLVDIVTKSEFETRVRSHLQGEQGKVSRAVAIAEAAWRRANPAAAEVKDLKEEAEAIRAQAERDKWDAEMEIESARADADAARAQAARARAEAEQMRMDAMNQGFFP